jgi:putative hemolysin
MITYLVNPEHLNLGYSTLNQISSIPISDWIYVLCLTLGMILLLSASAFISASETAFFSLDKIDLKKIADSDKSTADQIQKLLEEPDRLLATILIVNNTVNIGMILLSTLVVDVFQNKASAPDWLMFLIQVVGITALILLFGEIIPKVYATQRNKFLAVIMVKAITLFGKLFYFPAKGLVKISKGFDNKLGSKNKNLSLDELSEVHEIVQNKANKQEQKMLDGILEIGNTEAKQIMIPRTDMIAISQKMSYQDVLEKIVQEGISRIPVYHETIDNIKGILYIKDLIGSLNDKKSDFNWMKLVRQPYFVPETKKLDDLLEEFQTKKIHLAIVVDEYGGVEGLITLEDIIEEIVGDIKDEFDDDENDDYTILGDGKYIFDGKIPLLDMYRILDVEGEDFEEIKGEAETIAGLILEIKGGFPRKGEIITLKNYEFTVEHIDRRRIHRIKLEVK